MPTEHKKKKASKKEEKKLPIVIKSEPQDLKPLENYVDDRVELIQQIFSTLKSKTIQSIVPDFLQSKSNEELQEICLEEVLGISTKRLLSIINATKCPSDTESSDSDVGKVEEHISLEEISSDSNDELVKPKKKKKRDVQNKTTGKEPSADQPAIENNGKAGGKQYSMLELLELQARARAIRSQLALEPVTKIELDDSDSDSPNSSTNNIPAKSTEVPDATQNGETHNEASAPTVEATKPSGPIRLRRNFRQRKNTDNQSDDTPTPTEAEPPKVLTPPPKEATPPPPENEEKASIVESEPTVPNDDDIIPIEPEAEILCISSSESEDEEKSKTKEKQKKSYITMPVIEKEVREPTADELFLQKIKLDAKKKIENNDASKKADDRPGPSTISDQEKTGKSGDEGSIPDEPEEPLEDGEIIEEEEVFEIQASSDESGSESHSKKDEIEKPAEDTKNVEEEEQNTSIPSKNDENDVRSPAESSSSDSSDGEAENVSEKSEQPAKKPAIDDDDDDIIDLGKDDDLDFEIAEAEEQKVTPRRTRSKTKANEVSARDSSNEEQSKDQSWDKRWLRGSKVTKVLATSKLASKVRSKIKEKRTKNAIEAKKVEIVEPEKPVATSDVPADVEVGSVEHYKELTKQK